MLNFGFVNCSEQVKLCAKVAPKELPGLKVLPPVPIPSTDMGLELKKAVGQSMRYIKNHATVLTEENMSKFIGTDQGQPKVLLFSKNNKIPTLVKALSSSFKGKLKFGFVTEDQQEIISAYNVKTFPTILVLKAGEKRPIKYKREINFTSIFNFLNNFSE